MEIGKWGQQVDVIDFGLCEGILRPQDTHLHIPYRENKNLTGSAHYTAVNTNLGVGKVELFFLLFNFAYMSICNRTSVARRSGISRIHPHALTRSASVAGTESRIRSYHEEEDDHPY